MTFLLSLFLSIENGQEQPKRKRRRKRPPRSHASAQATSGGEVTSGSTKATSTVLDPIPDVPSNVLPATPASSPKRKKRSKSVPASAAASAVSLVLDSEKPKTAVKAKGKEKEFLVPVSTTPGHTQSSGSGKEKEKEKERERPPVTILRRPIPEPEPRESVFSEEEDDSDGHGGRTPTNFSSIHGGMQRSLGAVLDGSSSSISLMGKKGRRVGRKERDKEKMKMDEMKAAIDLAVNPQPPSGASVGGGDFGAEYNDADGDEDEDDEGLEPQEEEDENVVGTNDSLAGLSLLQPPRKKRDRSRRRKGRDTTHVHTLAGITGAYKSTPATPGQAKGVISDEMEEVGGIIKASTDENNSNELDVFESKPNETPGSEKRKRTRTKRVKALVHSTSVPQLKVDTAEMGEKPAEEKAGNDDVSAKTVKQKKGKSKVRPVEDEEDILDMNKNQLRQLITESARVGSRLLLSGGQPPEPQAQLAPETKRGRLLTLARKLKQLFPEQHDELGRVIARIEGTETTANSWPTGDVKRSKAVSIPAGKKKRPKKGAHVRTGSEGTSVEAFDFDDEDDAQTSRPAMNAFPDIEEEEDEEVDPRGRPPKKGDVLVHVFIDQYVSFIFILPNLLS